MIYLLVDQVAVQQPDEYRRPALVTLIKSATTKTQREKRRVCRDFADVYPRLMNVIPLVAKQ